MSLIENPDLDIDGIMQHLPGPDFPTAAIINGSAGIQEAYLTGRGRIYLRAKSNIEFDEAKDKQTIIITALPYQVNKANLLEKIADCCMHAGQSGQYNWQRGILRSDPFVTSTAKVTFCTEIMRMVYLLNRVYAPYYKWLMAGFKTLPILSIRGKNQNLS